MFDTYSDPVDAPVQPPLMVADRDLPATTLEDCIAVHGQRDAVTCTYGGDPTASRRIVLTGGSHSEHWLPALDLLGREHRFRVDTYVKVGCPPLSDPLTPLTEDSVTLDCDTWSKNVLAELAADPPDYVFTTSTRPREEGEGPGDYTPGWYVALWETLTSYGSDVLAIRDTPWMKDDGIPYRASDCLARGGDAYACGVARTEALDAVDPAQESAAHLPSVHPLDLSDVVCRAERCLAVEGNILIYRDRDHLTTTYVRTLHPNWAVRCARSPGGGEAPAFSQRALSPDRHRGLPPSGPSRPARRPAACRLVLPTWNPANRLRTVTSPPMRRCWSGRAHPTRWAPRTTRRHQLRGVLGGRREGGTVPDRP